MFERDERDRLGFPPDEVLGLTAAGRRVATVLHWVVAAALAGLLAAGGTQLADGGLLPAPAMGPGQTNGG